MAPLASKYTQMQNATDSPIQLSIRAVRSILLYCQDWDDKSLPLSQRIQSVKAGQTLCEAMMQSMIDDIPAKEASLLMAIFAKTSQDLFDCETNDRKKLIDNERALIQLLDILGKSSKNNWQIP